MKTIVVVNGNFDDLRSKQVRFLEEASKLGAVHVLLQSDDLVWESEGKKLKFSQEERRYLLEGLRFVSRVTIIDRSKAGQNILDIAKADADILWVDGPHSENQNHQEFCAHWGIQYRVITDEQLGRFPGPAENLHSSSTGKKKVVVTGCFDWFHSGHIRFFEEASQYGDLYVVVGSDENVRLLKGPGHPMFPQEERRYMVAAVRYIKAALISNGHGWMDAEPEINRLHPDIYIVNEDGDKEEKRIFCKAHSMEYHVLRRLPKEGLPRRESTYLRGF
jgi:cytidyltransferase-like protein